MKILLVLKCSPQAVSVHLVVRELVRSFYRRGAELEMLFLTGAAAPLASRHFAPDTPAGRQRTAYLELAGQFGFRVLCCGRALKDAGLDFEDLQPGIEAAGSVELAGAFASCDRCVEF